MAMGNRFLSGLAAMRRRQLLNSDPVLTATEIHPSVGLIGFSFGGSYGLVVAGRPETGKHLGWMITFGAYHNLAEVLEGYALNLKREPDGEARQNEAIYQQLVFLYGHREDVPFSQEVWKEAEVLLKQCAYKASFDEKRRFYDRYLRGLDVEIFKRLPGQEVLRGLSPEGNLERLDCPVTLIHDPHDHAVPPKQAERLFHELRTLHGDQNHQWVWTTLLSHVSPSNWVNVREVVRLARALSPLLP